MNQTDVCVTVEGGVADVQVNHPGITVVEVRDYDVDGFDDDHELLWTDENGDRCVRYVVTHDNEPPLRSAEKLSNNRTRLSVRRLIPLDRKRY